MNENIKLIGLTGANGAGKDTAADFIEKHSAVPVVRCALADHLRHVTLRMLPWVPLKHFTDHGVKDKPMAGTHLTPRDVLIMTGTLMRGIDPDIFVHGVDAVYKSYASTGARVLVLVTDVRQQNEADWVRRHGTLVHVARGPGAPVPMDWPNDWEIANHGTLGALEFAVRALLKQQAWGVQ